MSNPHIVALRQGNTQMRALRDTKKHIQNSGSTMQTWKYPTFYLMYFLIQIILKNQFNKNEPFCH